jgi:hypothetical protein
MEGISIFFSLMGCAQEAEHPSYLFLFPYLLIKIQNVLHACVEEGCSASLCIAHGKKPTRNRFHLRWS